MAYTAEEIEDRFSFIIGEIEKGKALRTILKLDNTPSSRTFFKWLDKDDSKVKRYARSTKLRADCMFEDLIHIADENHKDVTTTSEGAKRTDSDVIARARLRVDTRKWYLSKLNPKKYGDKVETTIEGGDKPVNIVSLGGGVKPE
jgi:hypothetical protein